MFILDIIIASGFLWGAYCAFQLFDLWCEDQCRKTLGKYDDDKIAEAGTIDRIGADGNRYRVRVKIVDGKLVRNAKGRIVLL